MSIRVKFPTPKGTIEIGEGLPTYLISEIGLNHNEINGVYFEKQYYFTNLLTKSKTFYNFVTSKFVLDVSEKYLGNTFRLKALRYYETYGKHQMQWHTDNKTDKSFAHIPGIIFIFYICKTKYIK